MTYSSSYEIENFLENIADTTENWSYMSSFGNFLRLVCAILAIIGMWNMFEKAGEPGWGSLIPYYKTYLLYKIADMKKMFWVYLISAIASVVLIIVCFFTFIMSLVTMTSHYESSAFASLGSIGVMLVIICALAILGVVLRIMNAVKLSQVFNLNGGYAVGLIFLPWLFYMIIGLSKEIHYKNRIPGMQGYAGQGGYQDPYANSYAQNPYQQNPYQQNPYQQNTYQQNTYQQNTYQQNPYQENSYQQNPYQQNTYSQTEYAKNAYDQNAAQQNPYANPPKEEAWKTIYDDDANNLNQ